MLKTLYQQREEIDKKIAEIEMKENENKLNKYLDKYYHYFCDDGSQSDYYCHVIRFNHNWIEGFLFLIDGTGRFTVEDNCQIPEWYLEEEISEKEFITIFNKQITKFIGII